MAETPLDQPNKPPFTAAFDEAVRNGGYTAGDLWNAYVNRDVLVAWADADWLDRAGIVERHSAAMRARFTRYHGTSEQPRTWGDAGNLVHYALKLGLIEEQAGSNGERGWRLLSREPKWIIQGTGYDRKAVQVRGLPPAEQAARDRYEASIEKRRATLNQKARVEANAEIARLVESTLRRDPDTVVPERWSTRGPVPEFFVATRLDGCVGVVREAHHAAEMDRHAVKQWIRDLKHEEICAYGRPRRRAEERAAQSPHAEVPEDDVEAMEALL